MTSDAVNAALFCENLLLAKAWAVTNLCSSSKRNEAGFVDPLA